MDDAAKIESRLAEFRDKAEPLGVVVKRVPSAREAAVAIREWATALAAESVVISSELQERAPALTPAIVEAGLRVDSPGPPEAVRDRPLGLSLAHLAIAETASVLLAEPTIEDRAVGMLCLAQAVVCPTAKLVASLDDAIPLLRERAIGPGASFATLVTGPSRTADIERVLTVGVQGPGKVMTLFIDAL